MSASSILTSSKSVYASIAPLGITANLVLLGTSMITSGSNEDLQLNPGLYSVDLDANQFNASVNDSLSLSMLLWAFHNWNYQYYCRIYGVANFPDVGGILISVGDPRVDPLNPSCLSNQSRKREIFRHVDLLSLLVTKEMEQCPGPSPAFLRLLSRRCSVVLVHFSPIARTSRWSFWAVDAINRCKERVIFSCEWKTHFPRWSPSGRNRTLSVTDGHFLLICFSCVISTLCIPNLEFQLINPTTQETSRGTSIRTRWTAPRSRISPNGHSSSKPISIKMFRSSVDLPLNSFPSSFVSSLGSNTSNFTASNRLFLANPLISLWRFEVVFSFPSASSSSALNFVINQPPSNDSCSIRMESKTILFTSGPRTPRSGFWSPFLFRWSSPFDFLRVKGRVLHGYEES